MGGPSEIQRLQAGLRKVGERMTAVEQRGITGLEVVVVRLDHVTEKLDEIQRGVDSLNGQVADNAKLLADHHSRLSVIEAFCEHQVRPALERVVENRVEIATVIAKFAAGGFGGVSAAGLIVYLIGKAAGLW